MQYVPSGSLLTLSVVSALMALVMTEAILSTCLYGTEGVHQLADVSYSYIAI